MTEKGQNQLFDGSLFDALVSAHTATESGPQEAEVCLDPKTGQEGQHDTGEGIPEAEAALAAAAVPASGMPHPDSPPEAWENYDWESYAERFFSALPDEWKSSPEDCAFGRKAGIRIHLARDLTPEIVSFLLRSTPPKSIWTLLQKEGHKELLYNATRGFQRTPAIVRQPVVRARILKWLEQNPTEKFLLLSLWADQDSSRTLETAINALAEEKARHQQVPHWVKKHGLQATLASLAWAPAARQYGALLHLSHDRDALEAVVHSLEEEGQDEGRVALPAPQRTPQQELEYWQEQAAQWEATATETQKAQDALLTRAEALQTEADKARRDLQKAVAHEATQVADWAKKLANLEARNRSEQEKLVREFERNERKLRAAEKDKAELETETRRLKKQLRQTQLLLEEARKKAAALPSSEKAAEGESPALAGSSVHAVSTPEATPATKNRPVVVAPPTPLDELFEWRADGRPVKLTARAVRRLVDANDEDAIYTIMQALDAVHERDADVKRRFLKRLEEAGAYYANVLTRSTLRVLVDASNVARYAPNRYGKGQLRYLHAMREELRRRDCFPIVFYADASLPYFIDEPRELRSMISRQEVIMADKGTEADELLAREARRTGAYVVTNDRLFFNKVSPDFEPPRITFRIYDGTVIVDEF